MDCAARPIIRKFMEADRTYSDGFIGASSNETKMDDFSGKHSGVTHQKMDHPIDWQGEKQAKRSLNNLNITISSASQFSKWVRTVIPWLH